MLDECIIKSAIRSVHDWPEPGVTFRDITPVFKDAVAFHSIIDNLTQHYLDADITHIAGMDARGFLLAAPLAYHLNLPLILVRKRGKLPGEVITEEYKLEYGTAVVEVQTDACSKGDRILLVDDLIATGGTLLAASSLLKRLGATVTEAAVLIDLPDLQGSARLQDSGIPVHALVAY